MMVSLAGSEARLERAATAAGTLMRVVAEVTDREVLSRLGARGMVAITLPPLALAQALLLKSPVAGSAWLPLVWCSLAYYMLRFRLSESIVAALAGAVLVVLAAPAGTSWWSALVVLAAATGCSLLRPWLYAEFWPAYAFVSTLFAVVVPAVCWLLGLAHPEATLGAYLGSAALAPLVGGLTFAGLDAVRRRLGIRMDFPEEVTLPYDASFLYRPYVTRRGGL